MGFDKKKHEIDKKRDKRRKRRIRSQIFAYLFLIVLIALLAFGIYKGVVAFAAVLKEQGQPIDEVISQDAVVSEEKVTETDAGAIVTPNFDDDLDNEEPQDENITGNDEDSQVQDENLTEDSENASETGEGQDDPSDTEGEITE